MFLKFFWTAMFFRKSGYKAGNLTFNWLYYTLETLTYSICCKLLSSVQRWNSLCCCCFSKLVLDQCVELKINIKPLGDFLVHPDFNLSMVMRGKGDGSSRVPSSKEWSIGIENKIILPRLWLICHLHNQE